MNPLHPTTRALLRAEAKEPAPEWPPTHIWGDREIALDAWIKAGCPDAPGFVPTEPGWYWCETHAPGLEPKRHAARVSGTNGRLVWSSSDGWANVPVDTEDVVWLGPVAPWNREARTADQERERLLARAKGCHDYGGGYHDKNESEIFHHGIQTVINALSDTSGSLQGRVLESIGRPSEKPRTAEDARRNPMRGDRWQRRDKSTFDLAESVPGDGFWWVYSDGTSGPIVGTAGMRFLGNFPLPEKTVDVAADPEVLARVVREYEAAKQPVPDVPRSALPAGRPAIFAEIEAERARQDQKWGEQNHPDRRTDGAAHAITDADTAKEICERRAAKGWLTWTDIAAEELAEAVDAETEAERRAELVQTAAVIVAWIERIDRRTA